MRHIQYSTTLHSGKYFQKFNDTVNGWPGIFWAENRCEDNYENWDAFFQQKMSKESSKWKMPRLLFVGKTN